MSGFAPAHLPIDERRRMCIDLLSDIGVTTFAEKGYELIHSCVMPFGNHAHGDRMPSASLNYERLTANCFVCGGGGLMWFLQTVKGETPQQVRQWLTKRPEMGGLLTLNEFLSMIDGLSESTQVTTPPIPHYGEQVLNGWRFLHPYLTEGRGIRPENIMQLQVGWNPQEDKIIIPHFWDGRLVGWQKRRLGGTGPKYISTPGFPRDVSVYNYRRMIPDVVVVESPMSVLTHIHQTHMEATFGAMVTQKQREALIRHSGRIVLWFDNDSAGWNATEQVGEWMMSRVPTWVADNPYVGDPADLDDGTFAEVLESHVVPWAVWQRPKDLLPLPEVRSVPSEEHTRDAR